MTDIEAEVAEIFAANPEAQPFADLIMADDLASFREVAEDIARRARASKAAAAQRRSAPPAEAPAERSRVYSPYGDEPENPTVDDALKRRQEGDAEGAFMMYLKARKRESGRTSMHDGTEGNQGRRRG